ELCMPLILTGDAVCRNLVHVVNYLKDNERKMDEADASLAERVIRLQRLFVERTWSLKESVYVYVTLKLSTTAKNRKGGRFASNP
ncbi:hypothetical protein J0S82_015937, partial [Galemys pyrenaicus]